MTIFKGSRLKNRYVYSDSESGETFIDPVVGFTFEESRNDLEIEWREGMRLDLVAKKLYGDEQLDWVILEVNPDYNTPFDIKSGDIVKVPHPDKVEL